MAEPLEAIVARAPIETLLTSTGPVQRVALELAATREALTSELITRLTASNLSPTGLLLARLSANEEASATPESLPLAGDNPSAEELRSSLQKSITQSGVFYESHLARWTAGTLPLEDILQEPQARARANVDTVPTDAPRQELPINEELAPILRRQISILENATLLWRGDVWPGQPAEIEIRPDNRRAAQENDASQATTTWTTRISLDLPELGEVQATIRLSGQSVALSIAGGAGPSTYALESGRLDLEEALAAHRISIERFSVVSNVPPSI